MVDADTCGYANYYYERIADCTCCGKLSGNGMDTIHHSKGYASCQSTHDHYRHVGIKSTISGESRYGIVRSSSIAWCRTGLPPRRSSRYADTR
jgi:hypothetical protein